MSLKHVGSFMADFGTQHAKQEANATPERQSPFSCGFIVMVLIGIGLLVGPFLYASLYDATSDAQNLTQLTEFIQLEHALESYIANVGVPPPSTSQNEVKQHIIESLQIHGNSISQFDDFPNDLDELDEREALVFWLGGKALERNSSTFQNAVYFEFPPMHLHDTDDDGWPEYLNKLGNCFIYRNGKILLHDKLQNKEYSLDECRDRISE